jgi:hypothetical protein
MFVKIGKIYLFINTTTNIEEKSIQQHGKGYIVPSKNNYRLDKIGCYMYTRPKSTRAKLCFSIKKQQYLVRIDMHAGCVIPI